MAAQVEVQTGEVGRTVAGGRLHLSPLTDSSNKNLIEIPSINQSHIITPEPNKPVPGPKPRLTPKPFAVEKNPTIKPILAPKPQTKPQPKPRPESTRLAGYKPELPSSPKPQQPVATVKPRAVSTNPNRPAPTSFKTSSKLNTGQTTKPVVQPFKPAPPLDPGDPSKPTLPVSAERQRPGASGLGYSKSLKKVPAEWSGTTKKEDDRDRMTSSTGGASMTRAKSMGFLLQVGQEEEDEKEKAKPERAVVLRPQPRGLKPRPVSAIFLDSPIKTEAPVPAPRWAGRRPLSADLTSKFESIGLSLHRNSPKANSKENTREELTLPQKGEQEKTPKSTTAQSTEGETKPAMSDQSNKKTEEMTVKESDEDKHGVSIKSRISLLLDSSSTPGTVASGQGSDPHSPVQLVPENEPAVGVKQLIKQLTEDTTPTQSPVMKPTPKPRPLPLDLTKRFASERSADFGSVSLTETTDHHEISKDPQRRNEELALTPSDHRTFVDLKDSQEQIHKASMPEGPEGKQTNGATSKESGGEVQTVRASLFENVVERHSVLVVDEAKPVHKPKESHNSPSVEKGNDVDEGTLVTATYKEPVSPSSPMRISHAFDTVQAIEENRAVSENVPSAQWEDKAMTLRSRRSEGSRPVAEGSRPVAEGSRPVAERSGPAQAEPTLMTSEQQPRFLRVGALQKWTNTGMDQDLGLEKGTLKEPQREGQVAMNEDRHRESEQEEAAAAPKRLKMLQPEEQQRPRATYFALTGQIQEPASPVAAGTNMGDMAAPSDGFTVRPTLGGSQGKILPAFGKTSHDQVEELMMRSHMSHREIRSALDRQTTEEMMEVEKKKELKDKEKHMAKMKELEQLRQLETEKQAHLEFARMKERDLQREFERQRQIAFEKEKQEFEKKQRALERQRQTEHEKQKQQELERERQRQIEKEKHREERERQREIEREKLREQENERRREQEKQRQREEERQRELEKEKQLLEIQKEKQRMEELQRIKELERQQILEFQKQKQREIERQQIIELEKQRQREEERQRQLDKEKKLLEVQKEKQRMEELQRIKELERQQILEFQKQKQREIERQQIIELEKQRQREEERQRQLDKEKKLLEIQKEKQKMEELERIKESERQQLIEFQKQKQREMERQQIIELEKQRLKEKMEREAAEKIKQIALEQEMLRLKEIDKERERQREMEKEKQREMERQRQLDFKRQELENQRLRQQELEKERQRKEEMERKRLLELEKQKQAERQQILEFEKRRLNEKMEREEAEKMRQIAKQQEAERQRLKEKQKKEEQERLRLEASTLRPKVVDLDSVFRNDPFPKAPSQRSDPATRWKEPSPRAEESYKPAILDIDAFLSQTQPSPSKDLFPVPSIQGVDAGFGAQLQPTPERDISWKVAQQSSGGFSSPAWTTSPQDPWELRPVEMAVDTPVTEPRKHSNKVSPEQFLLRQEERLIVPQGRWSALLDEPLHSAPFPSTDSRAGSAPGGVPSSTPAEPIWLLREPQPPERRVEVRSHRRSQGSQELNRMRSRSVSRRSTPSSSTVEGSLSRMRSRSAHRERDRHSWVQQKQSVSGEEEGNDAETPVRETDSQYGTWETGLRTDDSLTPATPSSESNISPSPRKPTPPHTPGDHASQFETDTLDGLLSPSSSDSQPLPFPDAPTTLLDTSALRSRAQLGKKRAPRSRPSRAARQSAALAEGEGGTTEDWLYRDSTESKVESKDDDSDSEEQTSGADGHPAVASPPQRVALFPGMDPSALKAQLKKRGDSDNQTDGPTPSPSQLSRSPKSPFLPRAARVLPPPGGKENGEEDSPQWLKELKSKKRLSQYENES